MSLLADIGKSEKTSQVGDVSSVIRKRQERINMNSLIKRDVSCYRDGFLRHRVSVYLTPEHLQEFGKTISFHKRLSPYDRRRCEVTRYDAGAGILSLAFVDNDDPEQLYHLDVPLREVHVDVSIAL